MSEHRRCCCSNDLNCFLVAPFNNNLHIANINILFNCAGQDIIDLGWCIDIEGYGNNENFFTGIIDGAYIQQNFNDAFTYNFTDSIDYTSPHIGEIDIDPPNLTLIYFYIKVYADACYDSLAIEGAPLSGAYAVYALEMHFNCGNDPGGTFDFFEKFYYIKQLTAIPYTGTFIGPYTFLNIIDIGGTNYTNLATVNTANYCWSMPTSLVAYTT